MINIRKSQDRHNTVAVQSKFAFFHQNYVSYFCTFVERQINEIVYKTDIEGNVFGKI